MLRNNGRIFHQKMLLSQKLVHSSSPISEASSSFHNLLIIISLLVTAVLNGYRGGEIIVFILIDHKLLIHSNLHGHENYGYFVVL
jgi:hypothetical protein